MEADIDQTRMELTFVEFAERETAMEAKIRFANSKDLGRDKLPTVLLVVECGSGLNEDSSKTMKHLLLKFVGDLKENNAERIFLTWNEKSYELTERPQAEIREILEVQHPPTDKHELSYRTTLQTLRHSIVSLKGKLDKDSNVSLVFFSSQIEPEQLLMEGSEECAFEKYLYSRNKHKEDLDAELATLRKVLCSSPANITVSAVGYGKYVDYMLMNKLVSLGRGSFSYSPTSYEALGLTLEQLALEVTTHQRYGSLMTVTNQDQTKPELIKLLKRLIYFQLSPSATDKLLYESEECCFLEPEEKAEIESDQTPFKFYQSGEEVHVPVVFQRRNPVDRVEFLQLKLKLMNYLVRKILTNNKVIEVERIPDPDQKVRFRYIKVLNKERLREVEMQRDRLRAESDSIYEQAYRMKVGERRKLIEDALELKRMLLVVEEHFVGLYKVEMTQEHFCRVMGEMYSRRLKNSFRKKLLRRMNANPRMIEEAYERIRVITQKYDEVELDNKYAYFKKEIGNCPLTKMNFVSALCNEDCLAIVVEIERPDTAIADPSRIVVRQFSYHMVSVSEFLMRYTGMETAPLKLEMCKMPRLHGDYGFDRPTVMGLVPVYGSPENWEVAKLLMKPCLGWTVCGEPLAYTFSQMQTVPFLLLAKAIEFLQTSTYNLRTNAVNVEESHTLQNYYDQLHQKNVLNESHERLTLIVRMLSETCKAIITDTSSERFEQPLDRDILQKYQAYSQPINRTVDVIPSNYVFLTQLVCLIQMGRMEKPNEEAFHEFFKRMVEEELRRQTDGWKEEEVQEQFINKILNVEVEKMDQPKIVVLESSYREKFLAAREGQALEMVRIEQRKQELEMQLKKDDNFNDVQRMLLIEYKRLYEHKAIQLWHLRFQIYPEIERKLIHKWKSLNLSNSYMLFCLIIQNKTQRKNAVRREVITNGDYVDPFDYYKARQFIEDTFLTLRQKQEQRNLKFVQAMHFKSDVSAFALTQDVIEAAGALLSCDVGHNVTQFYTALCEERRPEIICEKLNMLLTGRFQDVQIFPHGWKMSKKKMNRISHIYWRVFQNHNYNI